MSFLIIFCLGLIFLIPFSKDVRSLFKGIIAILCIYVLGLFVCISTFIALYGSLYIWSQMG